MDAAERMQFRRAVQPIFQDPFAAFNPFYRIDHVLTLRGKYLLLSMPMDEWMLADQRGAE